MTCSSGPNTPDSAAPLAHAYPVALHCPPALCPLHLLLLPLLTLLQLRLLLNLRLFLLLMLLRLLLLLCDRLPRLLHSSPEYALRNYLWVVHKPFHHRKNGSPLSHVNMDLCSRVTCAATFGNSHNSGPQHRGDVMMMVQGRKKRDTKSKNKCERNTRKTK